MLATGTPLIGPNEIYLNFTSIKINLPLRSPGLIVGWQSRRESRLTLIHVRRRQDSWVQGCYRYHTAFKKKTLRTPEVRIRDRYYSTDDTTIRICENRSRLESIFQWHPGVPVLLCSFVSLPLTGTLSSCQFLPEQLHDLSGE